MWKSNHERLSGQVDLSVNAYEVNLWVFPQVSHLFKIALQVFRRLEKRPQIPLTYPLWLYRL